MTYDTLCLEMAWKLKAFGNNCATLDQMELLEKHSLYKLKMGSKAKKEGHADDDQLTLINIYKSGKNWEEELIEFQETHGHCDVQGGECHGLAQ